MRISDWSSDVCSSDLLSLWPNPRVDAATEECDFDLRELRTKRMSIYLGVYPDELDRVAPLYNLLFQQLVDLNVRDLPDEKTPLQNLVLLAEFARIGRSEEHTSELQSLMRISYAVF